MKRQFQFVKNIMIICLVLCAFELILLCLEPDLKHIIFTIVCLAGLIFVVALFFIYRAEVKKIIFEEQFDNYCIRLIEYDDYQNIRLLFDDTPISNTIEEATLLEEYEAQTIDMIRIRYHYVIIKDDVFIGVIYSKVDKENAYVELIKLKEDEEAIKNHLIAISEKNKKKIIFK